MGVENENWTGKGVDSRAHPVDGGRAREGFSLFVGVKHDPIYTQPFSP